MGHTQVTVVLPVRVLLEWTSFLSSPRCPGVLRRVHYAVVLSRSFLYRFPHGPTVPVITRELTKADRKTI